LTLTNNQTSDRINIDFKNQIQRDYTVLLKQQELNWTISGDKDNCIGAKEEILKVAK